MPQIPPNVHPQPLTDSALVAVYRLFSELPFVGMAVCAPVGRQLQYVNQALCDLLGFARNVLLQRSWTALGHPDELSGDHALFDAIGRGERDGYIRDTRLLRADGAVVHATVNVQAVRDARGEVQRILMTVSDISARVEAEREARRAAALLKHLGQQVPGVIYQFQLWPDGRSCFPFASEAIREIYEVSPEDVRDDTTTVFSRVHADDLAAVALSIEESSRTLTPWEADYRVVLPLRGLRWLRGSARPERMDDGSTVWHGYITDITERQQAREALIESEQRFRIQIENATEAIVVFDAATGRFTDANRNAEQLFGLSRAALLECGILEVSPAVQPNGIPSAEVGFDAVNGALASEARTFEWTHRHVDGREFPCEVRLIRLPYEGRTLVRGSVLDISERKRAAAQLLRLEAAIESSINGVAMADLEGRLTYVNRAFCEIWGHAHPAEVLGRNVVTFWLDPAAPEAVVAALQSHGSWSGEMTAARSDGTRRELQLNASLFADTRGTPVGMLASFSDLTERKRLQEQLLQAQKMESVGRLAGGIAHDFNNLLTVITGCLDVALLDVGSNDELRADLTEIGRAADSAADLTRQLLAFSRKQIIAPKVLDLNVVTARVHGMLQRLLGVDITLEIVTASGLGLIRFDPGQAEQILVNLAVNARDAMPNGGRLTLETSNVTLDRESVRTHPGSVPGAYVMLAVSDTGVGMDADTLAHAFEPFFTTKPLGQGTGLGLAMIHGAVSQNGGRVEVYSEPGHGTSFKIYLPCVPEPASDGVVEAAGERPGGHETIVLVEDDDSVRVLVVRLLTYLGYRVFAFAGGEPALEWLSASPEEVHLLLTDVMMPGMNGRVLAERLLAARPAARVLFASGYTANVIVQHGVLKPGVEFIAKPFALNTLATRVRAVLDARVTAG